MATRKRDVKGKTATESADFISSLENHSHTIAKAGWDQNYLLQILAA